MSEYKTKLEATAFILDENGEGFLSYQETVQEIALVTNHQYKSETYYIQGSVCNNTSVKS